MKYLVLVTAMLFPCGMLAVSPLITDDADPVEPERLQLNAGWQFSRTSSLSLHSFTVNPVLGLNPNGELGATFGYQWSHASHQADSDGISDLTLSTKWRLWQMLGDTLKVSARLDLKLPTASREHGFGTGNVDMGGVLIVTRCWRSTCLDWNIGYTANDATRSVFGDDKFFAGQAVRSELTKHWTMIGEAYTLVPTSNRSSANVHFNGGVQFSARDSVLFSLLAGSAAGHNSPDLTSYFGFTWLFN